MGQITNLSQFKKALQVGRDINCTVHKMTGKTPGGQPIYIDEMRPTRKISIVQSVQFAVTAEIEPGNFTDVWATIPPAKECEFTNNGVTFFFIDKINNIPRRPLITYSFPQ